MNSTKEGRFNLIEGIDVEIFSSGDNHSISIYNDQRETSVSFSVVTDDLKELIRFVNDHLNSVQPKENNAEEYYKQLYYKY